MAVSERCLQDARLPDRQGGPPSSLLAAVFAQLTSGRVPFCVLHGYAGMPDHWSSDVDMCVDRRCLGRAIEIIFGCAADHGWTMCSAVQHEHTAVQLHLARQEDSSRVHIVIIDLCSDYRYNGLVYLTSDQLLHGRRALRGFFVPAPHVELAYTLVKRVLKRTLRAEHETDLTRLYSEDSGAALTFLAGLWGESPARQIAAALDGPTGTLSDDLVTVRRQVRDRARLRTVLRRPMALPFEVLRLLHRTVHPAGYVVCLLGPDGAGKTTVMSGIASELAPLFRQVEMIHLRPRLRRATGGGPPVTDPHGKPDRPTLVSLVKLMGYVAEHAIAFQIRVRPVTVRYGLVLFDRYYHDLLVDPRRYRFGAPLWIARLVARIVPRLDCTIVLDAPTEVIRSRKAEVSPEEADRQRAAYLRLANALPNTTIVDAGRPINEVMVEVNAVILEGLKRRLAERVSPLGLR